MTDTNALESALRELRLLRERVPLREIDLAIFAVEDLLCPVQHLASVRGAPSAGPRGHIEVRHPPALQS